MQRLFGLIGYPLSHSFSVSYFADKFEKESIDNVDYRNFPISDINELPSLWRNHPSLVGLNVTIPYKQDVISYLDDLASDAKEVNAVNTVKKYSNGRLKGFNTDIYGFAESLDRFIPKHFESGALILGTGGASKAVRFVCQSRSMPVQFVSRIANDNAISYADINAEILHEYKLIVNTSPVGMYPDTESAPGIPYLALAEDHYLLDLIYNPAVTSFLSRGAAQGAQVKNGLEMLILQAEKSWEIWNNPDL